jgi:hypothetical protein
MKIPVHPVALEQLRARTRRPAHVICHEAGMELAEFRMRLREQSFTAAQLERLANALQVTTRDIITTSTVRFTAERLQHSRSS